MLMHQSIDPVQHLTSSRNLQKASTVKAEKTLSHLAQNAALTSSEEVG